MELSFNVTKEDLIAAKIYRGRVDRNTSKKRLILPLVLIGVALYWFFVVPFKMPSSLDELTNNIGLYFEGLAVIVAFLVGCVLLLFGGLRRKFAENRIRSGFDYYKRWFTGEQKLLINDNGVTLINSQEFKYGWLEIFHAAENDNHVFIYPYGAEYDIAIPKKELPTGTANEIMSILRSHNVNILRNN